MEAPTRIRPGLPGHSPRTRAACTCSTLRPLLDRFPRSHDHRSGPCPRLILESPDVIGSPREVQSDKHRDGTQAATKRTLARKVYAQLEATTATETSDGRIHKRVSEPTPASVWHSASGAPITDRLLEWPPDVFAFT